MTKNRLTKLVADSFGERLKSARKHLGLTQEELATKAGVSTITLSKLESGTNKPSFEVIAALSYSMDVEPNYFFGWANEVSKKANLERRMRLQSLLLSAENLNDDWIDEFITLAKLASK